MDSCCQPTLTPLLSYIARNRATPRIDNLPSSPVAVGRAPVPLPVAAGRGRGETVATTCTFPPFGSLMKVSRETAQSRSPFGPPAMWIAGMERSRNTNFF